MEFKRPSGQRSALVRHFYLWPKLPRRGGCLYLVRRAADKPAFELDLVALVPGGVDVFLAIVFDFDEPLTFLEPADFAGVPFRPEVGLPDDALRPAICPDFALRALFDARFDARTARAVEVVDFFDVVLRPELRPRELRGADPPARRDTLLTGAPEPANAGLAPARSDLAFSSRSASAANCFAAASTRA